MNGIKSRSKIKSKTEGKSKTKKSSLSKTKKISVEKPKKSIKKTINYKIGSQSKDSRGRDNLLSPKTISYKKSNSN